MRFLENGPNIPDELLWDRDEGNVVFLCGAGISMPSGLPSFWELTKYVIDKIDPSSDSDIARAFAPWVDDSHESKQIPVAARISFDQIFNLLIESIGKEAVDRHVFDKLSSADPSKQSNEHEILVRLSSNAEGRPQIVTTNFDRLFDSALKEKSVQNFIPPMFPNLEHSGVDATGVTYLHGRLPDNPSDQSSFVLSSSDFGRAYLSEGWATSFIRNLLQRYTVVLVGYSAEDPPVKYLLQGLASSRLSSEANLYAFDSGTDDEVRAKWKDRGVKTIAYAGIGSDHSALWGSLSCWADRADSVIDWRKSVLELAQSDPKMLKPYERGMVTHLVSSAVGAHEFSKILPSPPAEWLCVFDVNCRYAVPYKAENYGIAPDDEDVDIEPLELYGLDDDPSRPEKGRDIISWLKEDVSIDSVQRLAGGRYPAFQMITPRLSHLSDWICKQIDSPVLAWWFARQSVVHESLKTALAREINRSDELLPALRKVWDILFEGLKTSENNLSDYGWFEFKNRFKKEGWTQKTLWKLEDCLNPQVILSQSWGKQKSVPFTTCSIDKISIQHIARVEVGFPKLYEKWLDVEGDELFKVISIVQRSLIRGVETLSWLGEVSWKELTVYGKNNDHEFSSSGDIDDLLFWFVTLFDKLIEIDPEKARGLILQWPKFDVTLFNKLHLYALNQGGLYSDKEVFEYISKLPSKAFWNLSHRNELLFLLRDRMNELSEADKKIIYERLFETRNSYHSDTEEEYELWKYDRAVEVVEWLRQVGIILSDSAEAKLSEYKKSLPKWADESAKYAIKSSASSRAEWVRTNEDCEILLECRTSQIVSLAIKNTKSDFFEAKDDLPFNGLVKTNPKRALLALGHSARNRYYPSDLWSSLFSNWPTDADDRSIFLLAYRMPYLPIQILLDNKYQVATWLERNLKSIYKIRGSIALKCLDGFIAALIKGGSGSTTSSLTTSKREMDRLSFSHAINSPVGNLVQGILGICTDEELVSDNLVLFKRLELLVNIAGEGKSHALCILADSAQWLAENHFEWFRRVVFPYFDISRPESIAVWNGLFRRHHWHHIQNFALELKPLFLNMIADFDNDSSSINSSGVLVFLIEGCVFSNNHDVIIEYQEVKNCLRKVNDDIRADFIQQLIVVGSQYSWDEYVIPFIHNAWPIEQKYKSSMLSKAWLGLLDDTGDSFPMVLSVIKDYLVPIHSTSLSLYKFHLDMRSEEPVLAEKFPEESLEILSCITPPQGEHNSIEVEQVLNIIVKSKPHLERDSRYTRLKKLVAEH